MNQNTRVCGIYAITHIASGKIYIGSSVTIWTRWRHHRNSLRLNKHPNQHLNAAWQKYGEAAFKLSVVEICPRDLLIAREQHWVDALVASGRLYNLRLIVDRPTGVECSAETRAKISQAAKGRIVSESTRKAISEALTGGKRAIPFSAEEIARRSRTWRITSPTGEVFTITNLKKFATDRDLQAASLVAVADGRYSQHKGWKAERLFEVKKQKRTLDGSNKTAESNKSRAKTYKVIDPGGNEFIITNLNQFCRENGLLAPCMLGVASGRERSHRKWKCERMD